MSGPALTIAFFGHDVDESTVTKRAAGFMRAGCTVEGFMFRRPRPGLLRQRNWRNLELGITGDRSYLRRLPVLLAGMARTLCHAPRLRRADVIYTRNVDMLAVALVCKLLCLAKGPLVYEVLDIQRPLTRRGPAGAVFRAIERLLLTACPLLVVSSPDFVSAYFGPVQGRWTRWFLLENKLPPTAIRARADKAPGPPWVIGWFGTLRCRHSFAMLCRLAEHLEGRLIVRLAGRPSPTDLSLAEIQQATRRCPNIRYDGGYDTPEQLAALYGPIHFSWCIDYTDAGTNSDWLLPNRVYEGGLNGAIALARADTATGRFVTRLGLGLTFGPELEQEVGEFLSRLQSEDLVALQAPIMTIPDEAFVDRSDTAEMVELFRSLAAHTDPWPEISSSSEGMSTRGRAA